MLRMGGWVPCMSLPRRFLPCREIRWVLAQPPNQRVRIRYHRSGSAQPNCPGCRATQGAPESALTHAPLWRKGRCCGTRSRRGAVAPRHGLLSGMALTPPLSFFCTVESGHRAQPSQLKACAAFDPWVCVRRAWPSVVSGGCSNVGHCDAAY